MLRGWPNASDPVKVSQWLANSAAFNTATLNPAEYIAGLKEKAMTSAISGCITMLCQSFQKCCANGPPQIRLNGTDKFPLIDYGGPEFLVQTVFLMRLAVFVATICKISS